MRSACTAIRMKTLSVSLKTSHAALLSECKDIAMTLEQQRDILAYTFKLLTDFCDGKPPKGSVARTSIFVVRAGSLI